MVGEVGHFTRMFSRRLRTLSRHHRVSKESRMTTSIHRRAAAPAIAFVAAGALAVAPVAVSPPDHPLASPRAVISKAVHLSAFVSPIETWTQVVQRTVNSLTVIVPQLNSDELIAELSGIGNSYATALLSAAVSSIATANPAP